MTTNDATAGAAAAAQPEPGAAARFWHFLPTLIWLVALGFTVGALIALS